MTQITDPSNMATKAPQTAGLGAAVRALDEALADHITVIRELVDIAQREQQHLIAFETEPLEACLTTKQAMVERANVAERRTRDATTKVRVLSDVSVEEASSLRHLASRLPGEMGRETLDRCSRLRSLAQTLDELQAISAVHAERGLNVVRAWTNLLTTSADAGAYGSDGRRSNRPVSPGIISRTV
jgi:flagellar biosynthesis/type III secretory pathway chaperone